MTHINRQKFLTELSKFLTFLTDEEREKVLERFEDIFDRCGNEEELLTSLDSPLKMTVEMSRAYTKGGLTEVLGMCDDFAVGQWIVNDEPDTMKEEVIQAIDEEAFETIDIVAQTEVEQSEKNEPAEIETREDPLDDGLIAVFEQDMKEQESANDEEDTSEVYILDDASEKETALEESPEVLGDAPEAEEEIPGEIEEPEVIEEPEIIEEPGESQKIPAEEVLEVSEEPKTDVEILREEIEDLEPSENDLENESAVRYKARWWALLPYVIIAIPLGLVGVAICAVITAAILAVAAGLVGAVVMGASLALESGMDVLADIILVAGATLVATGLALLVIWLAVWFAVSTIGGIVGGLYRLGRKWCYKEVVKI